MGQMYVQAFEPMVNGRQHCEFSWETSLPAPDSGFLTDFPGVSPEILDRCPYPVEKCNHLP